MGTFVTDSHKDLIYKVFVKQQLVNYNNTDAFYKNSDSVNLKIFIADGCEDKISVRIISILIIY